MSVFRWYNMLITLVGCVLLSQNAFSAVDPNGFDKDAFYTITNSATGKTLAITYEVPPDVTSAKSNNPSKTKVTLSDLMKKTDDSQSWQIRFSDDSYLIYSKIADEGQKPSGILKPYEISSEFADPENHKGHEKYNRVVVGPHPGETKDYWYIVKLKNGKYRISNALGVEKYLRKEEKAKGTTSRDGWFELRSLEAYKAQNGQVYLRHGKTADIESQYWTITKAGY